jgi:hypothetical protein
MTSKATTPRKKKNPQSAEPNEGEGNYTATRAFDADERKFVASGQVEKKAREAKEAFEGKEGNELRRAEELGKSHSKGEDPEIKR